VPRQRSSGGKDKLGGISKQGDRYLRSLFTTGGGGDDDGSSGGGRRRRPPKEVSLIDAGIGGKDRHQSIFRLRCKLSHRQQGRHHCRR
jgi:Transposase IS116/IS110/IS902 family